MTVHSRFLVRSAMGLSFTAMLVGCTCSRNDGAGPAASAAPSASTPAPAPAVSVSDRLRVDRVMRIPSGPVLQIIPGQGVGAIRLGATAETIERLMAAPCEFKTERACRYVGRAVEFFMDDKGFTNEIRIHRVDRPTTPEGRTFGVFNGRMEEGVTFMMLPQGVLGLIGPPQKTEEVTEDNPFHTVRVATYDGMRIEYDRMSPEKIVVGGIILTKGTKSPPAPSASASAPRPKPKAAPAH
jgi:hypothetical protein